MPDATLTVELTGSTSSVFGHPSKSTRSSAVSAILLNEWPRPTGRIRRLLSTGDEARRAIPAHICVWRQMRRCRPSCSANHVGSLSVDDPSQVVGRTSIRGRSRLGIMACQHLGPMSLTLGDHADIEPGVEEFRGCELAESEDRTVEVEVPVARCPGMFPPFGRRHGKARPSFAVTQRGTNLSIGHTAARQRSRLRGWPSGGSGPP